MARPGEIPDNVVGFVERAREFCRFVDELGTRSDRELELRELGVQLARLYAAGLALPEVDSDDVASEPEPVRPGLERLNVSYWLLFNPLELEEPVAATLADDVGDIYLDVARGLALFDDPTCWWRSAAWSWRFHMSIHWGNHATAALRAIQWLLATSEQSSS